MSIKYFKVFEYHEDAKAFCSRSYLTLLETAPPPLYRHVKQSYEGIASTDILFASPAKENAN